MLKQNLSFSIFCAALVMPFLTLKVGAEEVLKPETPAWRAAGHISKGDNISGVACVKTGEDTRKCILAVDEDESGIFVTLS